LPGRAINKVKGLDRRQEINPARGLVEIAIFCYFLQVDLGFELCFALRRSDDLPPQFRSLRRLAQCQAAIIYVDRKEFVMNTGTVKFFNTGKGFGFIEQGGGQPDVFVHVSAVERAGMRTLVEGQKINFDIVADKRSGKSAAENIQAA
jgi:CspA family cold shock protein